MRTALRKNTVLALAAVAALSLSLTACGGDDSASGATHTKSSKGTKSADSSSTAGSTGSSGTSGSTSVDASGSTTADKSSSSGATGGSGSANAGTTTAGTAMCKANDLDFVFEELQQGTESAHLLITATNTGPKCVVKGIPIVTPGEMNGDVPHSGDDNAAQRIVLASGNKVYSAIVLDPTKQGGDSWDLVRLSMDTGSTDSAPQNLVTQKLKSSVTSGPDLAVTNWNTAKPYNF
ncbi:DUF4232 domain-containing protein [Streptomyces sp. R21]|uniref:DUF4232 domain-containing protein n=1 Tax=Streptomyces sp. R21 TaxID=3238627 RepID=A0AB39PA53_9ACTN